MDACDPNADIENLRQLIKINAGVDVKLTKQEICQAYEDIQGGKLPLPPLVMNSTRTYLVDKKSPLKPNDYELLFNSSTKRVDLKRIARKVELKNVEQMTKSQIVTAIGKRLRYMKVHEPVKFAKRTRVTVNKTTAVNENNTAVNTVNNTTQTNNLNVNRVNTNNVNVNRVNTNNVNVNRMNTNRMNTTNLNSARPSFGSRPNGQRGMNFSGKGVFKKGMKPAFLGGNQRAVREPVKNNNRPKNMNERPVTMNTSKKPGIFGSIFGKKKPVQDFKQGNKGLNNTINQFKPQPIPATQKIGTDLTVEDAVRKIKQLGLRREKKFLEKMELGTVTKKQVVAEAQQALEEEKRFLFFIDSLKLLNIESEYIKQRMAVDDLQQLRVEAQIKADERANVKRSNEEKMAMFLESTTLNKADKNIFLNRARQNSANVDKLIMEIKGLISQEMNKVLNNKRQEFRTLLKNYNKLSDKDKEDLVKGIDEKTNTNSMKKLAENLLKKRIEDKKNLVTQNLLSFLTPLKINQANKNTFVKRFKNDDVNVNSLKREALNLEKSKMSKNVDNLRTKLDTRLGEIGLNQVDQNSIMKKFRNGNRNVEKLVQEAKQLKTLRNTESGNKAKQEYISYLGTLPNLTNEDKKTLLGSDNLNRNRALTLSKQRGAEKKESEKKEFVGFLADLGLTNDNRTKMINKYNTNTLNVEALKKQAIELRSSNISEKKAKLLSHMNTLNLGNQNKQKLLNRIENTNLNTLKANANGIAKKIAGEKAAKERRELEDYINGLGLNINNRSGILNKKPSLFEGKRMANAKLREKQERNRQIRNLKELKNYVNNLGLNVNTKKSILNQDISISEKRSLADMKFKEKQERNSQKQNRKQLENYINELGLNTNNKVNILNKNPTLNVGRKLANAKLQMKIKEKRNKDRFALSVYLNKLGLSNNDKSKFLEKFNSNVNANTVKANASMFIQNKKGRQRLQKRQELQNYISRMNLTNQEQMQLLNMFNRNIDNVNAIKKEADTYVRQKYRQQRVAMREDLSGFLKGLNISQKDAQNIMKEFNNTNVNAQILKNRASGIVETRRREKSVKEEIDFVKYLNTLGNLTAENKTKITEKLNSYYVDWDFLKKSATNLALQRAKERRNNERNELSEYANNLGLNSDKKRSLLKLLNDKASNLSSLKKEAKVWKNQMNRQTKMKKSQELLKSLVNLDITNQNRNSFMEKFGNNTSTANAILQEAKQLETDRIQNRRNQLSLFINNLNLEQNDKNLVLKNFDMNPRNTVRLQKKAQQLKGTRNKEERDKIRRELKEYLNTLNMLNSSNKKRLMANNSKTFNNVKNEANQLQEIKKARSERKKEFEELSRYINSLNMLNKTEKQKLLANVSRNINSIRNEANQLQAIKKSDLERKKEREELSRYINTLNLLTKEDKQKLLENVTRTYNNVRNEANKLQEFKKTDKRGGELNTLKKSMNGLNQNSQLYVIDKFETQNVTLNSMLKEVAVLKKKMATEKRAQNRSDLVDYMNTLDIGNADKKKILKNYDSQKANFGTLKNRVTQINATIKNKAQQRQELSNYINTLGVNGTQLIKKFDDGRSTLNRLKADADKMKTVANARLVNTKRDQLRAHMKNTRLDDKNKKSFINRVTLDTNMNSLKGEVNNLNAQLKTRNDELAAKKSEVSVFLNTLNDLRPENRKAFLAKVVGANTNTDIIKKEATAMNKAVKNRRAEKERQDKEKKEKEKIRIRKIDKERLDKHLKGLKHLTTTEMMNYITSFERNGAKIENVIATSKAKDKDNEKDKDTLKFYIRDANIPQLKKDMYLRQLLQPHINTAPIKKMVNVNKERERLVGEQLKAQVTKKLQSLKTITANDRVKFLNNLKTKPPNEVMTEAEKLDKERRAIRDKGIKDVANQLSKLTSLERNNRKKLMNRLPTNGPEKVLANAKDLNKQRKNLVEKTRQETEAKKKAEEEKKAQNTGTKKLATNLQALTSLTRENRKKLMNRLPTNGAQKVLANAKKLNQDKKNTVKKAREGVEFKLKQIGMKGSNLEALMKRWNDTKNQTIFDDARKKVEANKEKAMAKQPLLNRVLSEIPGTFGIFRREWESAIKKADKPEELQRLGRLLDQKVKLRGEIEKAPIADDKRRGQLRFVMKLSNDVEKRQQELAGDIKAKRGEGDKVKADTAKKLQSMNKLERTNRISFMNRITKGEDPRVVLKNAENTVKKRVEAERKRKLDKRQKILNEISKHTNERITKLKGRAGNPFRKEEEYNKIYEDVKEMVKLVASEKGKAKGDVARSLQGMKGLNRSNRKEFMARLNRGNDPSSILRNAQKRSTEKEFAKTKPTTSTAFIDNSKFKTTNNPLFRKVGKQVVQNIRMKTMTNAVKKAAETEKKQQELSKLEGPARVAASRNLGSKQGRDRGQTAEGVKNIFSDQKKKNREEAQRRGVSVKRAQRNRQMREKEERAKARASAEAKSLKEKEARNKIEAARAENERRRLAMLESQKKKDAKAALRKQNKKLARATGQGVKATQKKQQAARRRK